jgi:hypothetical protein
MSADVMAQLSQEIYSSGLLHLAIKKLPLLDFEVPYICATVDVIVNLLGTMSRRPSASCV